MRSIVMSGLLLMSAGSASAQSSDAGKNGLVSTFVRGRCSTLVIAGQDMSGQCSPALVNVAYPSGATSFMFTLAGKAMVSFFGRQAPAVGERAMVYLERVSFRDSTANNPSSEVSGTCKFGNPYAGPTEVDCEADSKDGPFKAVFTTDGQRPEVARN